MIPGMVWNSHTNLKSDTFSYKTISNNSYYIIRQDTQEGLYFSRRHAFLYPTPYDGNGMRAGVIINMKTHEFGQDAQEGLCFS